MIKRTRIYKKKILDLFRYNPIEISVINTNRTMSKYSKDNINLEFA